MLVEIAESWTDNWALWYPYSRLEDLWLVVIDSNVVYAVPKEAPYVQPHPSIDLFSSVLYVEALLSRYAHSTIRNSLSGLCSLSSSSL